jgi:hypothetical protein
MRLVPRPRSFAAALAGTALLALAGCGGDVEPSNPDPTVTTSAGTPPPASGTGPGDAAGAAAVAASVVGLGEAAAVSRIEQAGYTWRILARDGEDFPVTMDYSETRIGLQIVAGKVVGASVG